MESSMTDPPDTLTLDSRRDNSALSSVVEVAAETSDPTVELTPAASPCPRCGGKLTNPEGLGWCSSCGYCRSLEQDANKAALAAPPANRQPSPLGVVEFFEVLGRLPGWLWVLLGGTTIVAVISLAADVVLPDDSLARALWCTIQVGAGLIGLFVAQVWAFMLIAPESDRISAKDLILSARLWNITCRRLPETQRQVWLGGWSLAAMLSGVFLVGGYSYWYQFYKPKKIADKGLIQAIANAAKGMGKNKSLEESVEEFANSQDLTKKKDDAKKAKDAKEDRRPTQDCVIIGYTVENDQKLRKEMVTGLVLATVLDGRLRFAGVVRRGVDPRMSDELLKRLAPLIQDEPLIAGLTVQAIWVKPQVFCEVHQSGFDADGHLRDPKFKELLSEQ